MAATSCAPRQCGHCQVEIFGLQKHAPKVDPLSIVETSCYFRSIRKRAMKNSRLKLRPVQAACLTVVVTALLSSCSSKELDRERAEEVIAKAYNYPNVIFREQQMFINSERRGRYMANVGALLDQQWINVSPLVQQGLISDRQDYLSRDHAVTYVYSITDKGKAFLKPGSQVTQNDNSGFLHFEVKICNARIKEVTGIRMNGEQTSAQVDYTIELYDFTPFLAFDGQKWPQEQSLSVQLELFDDGWRISPNEKMPQEPDVSVAEFEAYSKDVIAKAEQTKSDQPAEDERAPNEGDNMIEGDSDFPGSDNSSETNAAPQPAHGQTAQNSATSSRESKWKWEIMGQGRIALANGQAFSTKNEKAIGMAGRQIERGSLDFAMVNGGLLAVPFVENRQYRGQRLCDLGTVTLAQAAKNCPDQDRGCPTGWGSPPTVQGHTYALSAAGRGFVIVRVVSLDGAGGGTLEWAQLEVNKNLISDQSNHIAGAGEHSGTITKEYIQGRWESSPHDSNPAALAFSGENVTWEQDGRKPTIRPYKIEDDTFYVYEESNGKTEWFPVFKLSKVDENTMLAGGQMRLVRAK